MPAPYDPVYGPLLYGDGEYGEGAFIDAQGQDNEHTKVRRSLTPLPPPVFAGMKLKADVFLGDLVLNTIDDNNVIWVCTDIDGWWVHPDPEIPNVDRGWSDGSYDARGRWQARQLTLDGVILPPDPEYLPGARDALIRATSLVYTGAWLKTRENPTRASYVRLSGRPEIATVNARGRTEFSIGLRAADPIKYSWNDDDEEGYNTQVIPAKNVSTPESGERTITNVGNTSVSVFIEVTGPTTGQATIYNSATDQLMTITDALRASETRSVTSVVVESSIATVTTSANHTLAVGDFIDLSGVTSTIIGTYEVVDIPAADKASFVVSEADFLETPVSPNGTLVRDADFLEIDTYDRTVAFNGVTLGARAKIDTLVDWLTLAPGANKVSLLDEGTNNGTASMTVYYRSGWIG
jgi:hypothetical protein